MRHISVRTKGYSVRI